MENKNNGAFSVVGLEYASTGNVNNGAFSVVGLEYASMENKNNGAFSVVGLEYASTGNVNNGANYATANICVRATGVKPLPIPNTKDFVFLVS